MKLRKTARMSSGGGRPKAATGRQKKVNVPSKVANVKAATQKELSVASEKKGNRKSGKKKEVTFAALPVTVTPSTTSRNRSQAHCSIIDVCSPCTPSTSTSYVLPPEMLPPSKTSSFRRFRSTSNKTSKCTKRDTYEEEEEDEEQEMDEEEEEAEEEEYDEEEEEEDDDHGQEDPYEENDDEEEEEDSPDEREDSSDNEEEASDGNQEADATNEDEASQEHDSEEDELDSNRDDPPNDEDWMPPDNNNQEAEDSDSSVQHASAKAKVPGIRKGKKKAKYVRGPYKK